MFLFFTCPKTPKRCKIEIKHISLRSQSLPEYRKRQECRVLPKHFISEHPEVIDAKESSSKNEKNDKPIYEESNARCIHDNLKYLHG